MPPSLSISPDAFRNGAPSRGTVSLAFPDPAPTTVLLFSGDPTAATVPGTTVVPVSQYQPGFTGIFSPLLTITGMMATVTATMSV